MSDTGFYKVLELPPCFEPFWQVEQGLKKAQYATKQAAALAFLGFKGVERSETTTLTSTSVIALKNQGHTLQDHQL